MAVIVRNYEREKQSVYHTWQATRHDVDTITRILKEGGLSFDGVYGEPRGGLILAVCLSHSLEIPLILDEAKITEKTLIVDDIVDSGATLREYFKKNFIAVLYYNPERSSFEPNLWLHRKEGKWIIFAWEAES